MKIIRFWCWRLDSLWNFNNRLDYLKILLFFRFKSNGIFVQPRPTLKYVFVPVFVLWNSLILSLTHVKKPNIKIEKQTYTEQTLCSENSWPFNFLKLSRKHLCQSSAAELFALCQGHNPDDIHIKANGF